jgi:hypothetical protein
MDSYTEKTTRGLGTNLMDSIKGVVIGLLLFLGSFAVLWINEGRLDMSKVAKKAEILAPNAVDLAMNGKWVSLTAPVALSGSLEDPQFLQAGPYLQIERDAEMFVWVEEKESKEEKKVGGSTETTTTYKYTQRWTSVGSVKAASSFKIPKDHDNPTTNISADRFSAAQAMIGPYGFSPKDTDLPSGERLTLTPALVKPGVAIQGDYLYLPAYSSMVSPSAAPGAVPVVSSTAALGDVRVSFRVVRIPSTATIFGVANNGTITKYVAEDGDSFLRLFASDREGAIKTLSSEFTTMTWVLRLVGFLMMWIGLSLFFGPINALLDILPFLGSAGRFLVGVAIFPIALVLTLVTVLISIIFHNIYLLIAILVLLVGLVFWRARSRRSATQ